MAADIAHQVDSIDRFYHCKSVAECHPDRLATVGTLYGLECADVRACRVLELGCADGGNLIPLAELFPDSQFVGIDRKAEEIAAGQRRVSEFSLSNICLSQTDILDIRADYGQFDFIICHGVFCWVPAEIQNHIIQICRDNLGPHGVACLNYNTYPGWHNQGMIRDFVRLAAMSTDDPQVRVQRARDSLAIWAAYCERRTGLYSRDLAGRLRGELKRSSEFLFRAYLDVKNEPLHFLEFLDRIGQRGLQYLGDSAEQRRWTSPTNTAMESMIAEVAPQPVQREQFWDYLTDRCSRYSLICHDDIQLNDHVQADRLADLFVRAELTADPPLPGINSIVFRAPDGRNFATDNDQLKTALYRLSQRFPEFVSLESVLNAMKADEDKSGMSGLLEQLADLYERGLIDVCSIEPMYTFEIGKSPCATKTARHQARRGDLVTNLRHEMVTLTELDRAVLVQLDGQTSLEDLCSWRTVAEDSDERSSSGLMTKLEASLERLARSCLLLRTTTNRSQIPP